MEIELNSSQTLLNDPNNDSIVEFTRNSNSFDPLTKLSSGFNTREKSSTFSLQYANVYFLRLTKLKPRTLENAKNKWGDLEVSSMKPKYVDRVLEVQQGELCYVIGTVYMEMPLKPNVLIDLAREHVVTATSSAEKFCSPDKDEILLEDESGRIKLVGDKLKSGRWKFVTGIICGVLGYETKTGDFEVVDVCFADIAPQTNLNNKAKEEEGKESEENGEWIGIVSGLEFDGQDPLNEAKSELLSEYIRGELGTPQEQELASNISSLVIVGNSMINPIIPESTEETEKKTKKYGYDSSTFNAEPAKALDGFMSKLLPLVDIHLLPGAKDPTGPTMPQQPLHRQLFKEASSYKNLYCHSNPTWAQFGEAKLLATSGQTIDDIYKYMVDQDRMEMVKNTLDWSHMGPTAPDTLWCFPFKTNDPFIIQESPHIYIVGNQPNFDANLVQGSNNQQVRVIMSPSFRNQGQIVLVNVKTLECKAIKIDI